MILLTQVTPSDRVRFVMSQSLLKQYQYRNRLRTFLADYWNTCGVLHRRNDLEQLIDWAKRKRFAGVCRAYTQRLIDEENRLWRLERRSPFATQLASIAVSINTFLSPQNTEQVMHLNTLDKGASN